MSPKWITTDRHRCWRGAAVVMVLAVVLAVTSAADAKTFAQRKAARPPVDTGDAQPRMGTSDATVIGAGLAMAVTLAAGGLAVGVRRKQT